MNTDDIKKEADEIQNYLDIVVSDVPEEIQERISTLMSYMSRSGNMLAVVKKILRAKKTTEINKTIISIAKTGHLSATVQNALLDSICEDEAYLVDWIERINRGCVHQIDGLRSLLSYEKENLRLEKTQKTNFANGKKMPLCGHENILVFYKKLPTYNPIKYYSKEGIRKRFSKTQKNGLEYEGYSGGFKNNYKYENKEGMMLPDSVITFSNWNGALFGNTDNTTIHPTQKPVPLLRYLIKTFSNEGDTIFDGFSGSGSTLLACFIEQRNFIGCELDKDYFDAGNKRFENYKLQFKLF